MQHLERRGRAPIIPTKEDPIDALARKERLAKLTIQLPESLRIRAHMQAQRQGISLSAKIRAILERWTREIEE